MIGKPLFRKPHFLKHLQGLAKVTCISAFKHRFPQPRGAFQRPVNDPIAYGKSGNTRTDAPASGKKSENRSRPNQTTRLASKTDRCGIVPLNPKSTCLFFDSLIHSTNPVGVALLRDGNPTLFSATLPL